MGYSATNGPTSVRQIRRRGRWRHQDGLGQEPPRHRLPRRFHTSIRRQDRRKKSDAHRKPLRSPRPMLQPKRKPNTNHLR